MSHDRAFLDNVITSTLVFEGQGKIQEYVGSYQDCLRQLKPKLKIQKTITMDAPKKSNKPLKLSYKEQRELEELPKRIESMEAEQAELQQITSSTQFYQQPQEVVTQTLAKLTQLTADIELAYRRWEALEKR
ncbi:MAG: hypothetical protein EPO11_06320 [Gammaproteobacteria bacterium]|nr:MAG: hypothetical protein EPO11_06320 [Gammaproteobacteria bacterium]